MGASQSTDAENGKLTLAEKRYRVNGLRRKSTRKTGNVTTTGCDMRFTQSSPSMYTVTATDDGATVSMAATDGNITNSSGGPVQRSNSSAPSPNNFGFSAARSASGGEIDARLFALYPQQCLHQLKQQQQQRNGGSSTTSEANAILFTRTQRVLIENSWKRCRKTGSESVGARIFIMVLTAQPDIKLLFGLEKIPQGRLKYDPRFRKHASVMTRTLDYIVKNLVYTEKLSQHFYNLGKKHCHMQVRAFQDHYWDAFAEAASIAPMESESGKHCCRETASAWRSLIAFVVKQMRRGFDDEKGVRKRFSASLIGIASVRAAAGGSYGSAGAVPTVGGGGGPRRSIRNLSDFRVASLSSIPLTAIPAATAVATTAAGGCLQRQFQARDTVMGRAPSLTNSITSSTVSNSYGTNGTQSGRTSRAPSVNSAASALSSSRYAEADNQQQQRQPKSHQQQLQLGQPSQQRSASWCAEKLDDAFAEQVRLTGSGGDAASAGSMLSMMSAAVTTTAAFVAKQKLKKMANSSMTLTVGSGQGVAHSTFPPPQPNLQAHRSSFAASTSSACNSIPPPLPPLNRMRAVSDAFVTPMLPSDGIEMASKRCPSFNADDYFTPPTSARPSADGGTSLAETYDREGAEDPYNRHHTENDNNNAYSNRNEKCSDAEYRNEHNRINKYNSSGRNSGAPSSVPLPDASLDGFYRNSCPPPVSFFAASTPPPSAKSSTADGRDETDAGSSTSFQLYVYDEHGALRRASHHGAPVKTTEMDAEKRGEGGVRRNAQQRFLRRQSDIVPGRRAKASSSS